MVVHTYFSYGTQVKPQNVSNSNFDLNGGFMFVTGIGHLYYKDIKLVY